MHGQPPTSKNFVRKMPTAWSGATRQDSGGEVKGRGEQEAVEHTGEKAPTLVSGAVSAEA